MEPSDATAIAKALLAKMYGENNTNAVELSASADAESEGEAADFEILPNGVALLKIRGTLVERSSWLDAYCGMISYDAIAQHLAVAESDARVRGILLLFDSPGGEVSGMFECARALATVTKPVYAVVDRCACSAAYLLAAQADMIFVDESSVAGSIGVIAQHMETSARDSEVGIKYTTIFAGARKNDGNPHEPLSDGARTAIQADVDDVMQKFVASVALARRVSEEDIRATEAGVFRGQHVITAGLADISGSPADALAALAKQVDSGSVAAATRLRKEVRMASTITADPKLAASTATEEKPEVAKTEKFAPTEEVKPEGEEKDPDKEEEVLTGAACREISTLCTIAGRPALAAEFIGAQLPVAKVRERLVAAAADDTPRIQSAIDPSIGAQPASINPNDPKQNPLLADAQRRAAAAQPKGAR